MKTKRLFSALLALVLVLGVSTPVWSAAGMATPAGAIPTRSEADRYFGKQLTAEKALGAESHAFYEALLAMYDDGRDGSALLTGADQEVGLTAAQVQAYLSGQSNLGHALTNARDAFYLDYPDLFYVNFNNFALRTKNVGGETKIYITPGTRGADYLLDGVKAGDVKDLVEQYDQKLTELTQAGTDAMSKPWENSAAAAQVRAVHDKLAGMLTYKLDDEVSKEDNRKYIRTAYGIVTGEGVCEAYSRAFKSAMDELHIPCVLVEGAFRHSADRIEAHMWACVQVEGAWYGVDVTMDDADKEIVDAYGRSQPGAVAYNDYLLAGDVTMGAQHAASTAMSAASYEFSYPALTQNDYAVVTLHNAGGLKVRLDQAGDELDDEGEGGSGTFYVSYNNMNYTTAAQKGYYILAHFMTVDTDTTVGSKEFKGTGEWSKNEDWSYLALDLYEGIEESATESMLPMPHVRYVQFAVTDVPPGDYRALAHSTDSDAIYNATHYQGDPSLLLAKTEVLENKGGDYVAPPYIEQAWPTQQSTMLIGHTYQVEVKMDDKLVPAQEGAPLGCEITCYAFLNGKREDYTKTAEKYYKMDDLAIKDNDDDTSTITFSFTPSEQWAHDTIFYEFHFTGVVGKKSGKMPNNLVYLASHPCSAYAYQSQGFDWNLYGKPQLMDDFANSDVSDFEGWEAKGDTRLSDKLKHRMTLVVNDTTPDQTAEMDRLAGIEAGQKPLKTETYSINLTVCKSQIVKTGQAVRVMLGFPEGYGPDDAGVTFKAYHYSVDELGNVTGVNEIPCIVTPQGLLVLCDSFSPFNICALPAAVGDAPAEKPIVVSTNCGGGTVTVDGAGVTQEAAGVYMLAQGHGCTVTVTPPKEQQISAITVGGRAVKVTDRSRMKVELTAEEMQSLATGIVEVQYAPEKWITEHENDPVPDLPEVQVSIPQSTSVTAGQPLTIKAAAAMTAPGARSAAPVDEAYACTYQWFKNGAELVGQTGNTLVIDKAGADDRGDYTVAVALSSKATGTTASKTGESEVCAVNVAAAPTNAQPAATAPAPDPTPEPTPTPTPAPAATAAPTQAGAGSGTLLPPATVTPSYGKGGPEPTPGATARPAAGTAPQSTPAPMPPAPVQTAPAPATAAPAPEKEKDGIPPLAVAGIAAAGLVVAGGLAWLFLPRRKRR